MLTPKLRRVIASAATLLCGFSGPVIASPLGAYDKLETYCGTGPIPSNTGTIPWVGCFALSPGHQAAGTMLGHRITLTVGADGTEAWTIDGVALTDQIDAKATPSRTNFPFVRRGGDGYGLCRDAQVTTCPAKLVTLSRNPDRSVLFQITECVPPSFHSCAGTRSSWDYLDSQPFYHRATAPE